jgi:cbb3-type cytochrome c oxidase subunit III
MYQTNSKMARGRPAANLRFFIILGIAAVSATAWLALHARAQEKDRLSSTDARKLKNPVPSDAQSIEAGKKLYQRYCASCHGPGGKGDGSMALSGGTPSDLTDETWDHGSSDGEIFAVIRDGVSSDMQAYKDKLTEKQIWQVINFIRRLGPNQSK